MDCLQARDPLYSQLSLSTQPPFSSIHGNAAGPARPQELSQAALVLLKSLHTSSWSGHSWVNF